MEQYASAIKDFRFVLERDPSNADALVNLGLAYMLANRPVEAKKYFEQALEIEQDPTWKLQLAGYIKDLLRLQTRHICPTFRMRTNSPTGRPNAPAPDSEKPAVELPKHSRITPSDRALTKLRCPEPGGFIHGFQVEIQFQQSGRNVDGVLRIEGRAGIEMCTILPALTTAGTSWPPTAMDTISRETNR